MSSSPIRVSVNLLWCVPGQVGGSEQYLVRQLVGLAEVESRVVPTLFAPKGFRSAHPELDDVFRIVEASITGQSRARRVLAEQFWLAGETRGSDLVHHGGGTMPRRGTQPTVLTIHDLQYLTYPKYLGSAKRAYLARVIPSSVRRATVITVPTEYVRGTVVDAYSTDPDKVIVVPHGMEPTLGTASTSESDLRDRFDLGDGPVIVLPAMTHPHKGHRFLLDVMARHWTDPALRLVLIGGAGSAEGDVAAAIAELRLSRRVVRAGRVTDADRDGLLRMATAMVFPSEYEGFGAPIIEAMALGTPVICSDRTCLPEVAGDAALVLPLEFDRWADALDLVATNRDEMIAAGHRRAADFTSVRSAEVLLQAYERALA